MRRAPCELAEACFAIARSTVHAGERQAAIGRGEAICAKYALALDNFDIPGRRRARPARPKFTFTVYESKGGRSLREELDRFAEGLRQMAEKVGAAPDETVYDARRRNFHEECARARARDAARKVRGGCR